MMGTLKKLLANEPLRVRVYGIAVLVLGYLFARGILKAEDVDFYVGLAALVLGVETARSKVTPADSVDLFTKAKPGGEKGHAALDLLVYALVVVILLVLALKLLGIHV